MSIANQVKSLTEDIEASYGTRIAAVSDIVKETHQTLGNFNRQHKKMADDLRDSLSASEEERIEEFTTLIGEKKGVVATIAKETQQMRAENVRELKERANEVRKMLGEFSADQRQARAHWQNLAKVMAAKRAGKSIPSAKAEMGVPAAVKEEAEEVFGEGELKERVLKVVQAHPGGIKLSEIGKTLKIAYIQAAKPIKDLLAEVKITKRDSEYVPA